MMNINEENEYYQKYQNCCGTCHYRTKDGKGYSCMNFNSPFAADWVDIEDGCNHYVEKRRVQVCEM